MKYKLSSDLRISGFDQDMIIMDVKQGKFYSCNYLGAIIVQLLQSAETLDSITQAVEIRMGKPSSAMASDIRVFLAQLTKKNLCHVSE